MFESDFYEDFKEFDGERLENQIAVMENNRKIFTHNKNLK